MSSYSLSFLFTDYIGYLRLLVYPLLVFQQVESRDYSHLPPEQRRKKLQKALVELRKDLSKEEEAR